MNKFLLAPVFFLCAILLCSCGSETSSKTKNSKPVVLVSVGPDAFFTKSIGGDLIDVVTIVPSGSSPHFFEPQPRQALELSNADLWFRRGEMFETRLLKTLKKTSPKMHIYDLRIGVPLIEGSCNHNHGHEHTHHGHEHTHHEHTHHEHEHTHDDEKDLHTWTSPQMAIRHVKSIAKTLEKHYPEDAKKFQENATALIKKLHVYHLALKANLKNSSGSVVLVSHPAFAYLCKDYGLEQVAIEVEGKEPHPRHIDKILKKLIEREVSHIFIQEQYNNKGALAISEMLHLDYTSIDPYTEDYFTMLKIFSENISKTPLEVHDDR
jgi:zinc transport system substrate-binding protein